ncbi:MAG: HIT family protein [Chloroflexota bacterium]
MAFTLPVVEPCPFCLYAAGEVTAAAGTGVNVLEDELAFSFVNPRAIQPGHLLVVPRRHAATILDLTADEAAAVMRMAHRVAPLLVAEFQPMGMNIFQNNGVPAGQTVPHYHVHVVPRYENDGGTFIEPKTVMLAEREAIAARLLARL